eukprot:COSAG02_NODE_22427_length_753_cov_0.909786_1_plen_89_part_10
MGPWGSKRGLLAGRSSGLAESHQTESKITTRRRILYEFGLHRRQFDMGRQRSPRSHRQSPADESSDDSHRSTGPVIDSAAASGRSRGLA